MNIPEYNKMVLLVKKDGNEEYGIRNSIDFPHYKIDDPSYIRNRKEILIKKMNLWSEYDVNASYKFALIKFNYDPDYINNVVDKSKIWDFNTIKYV